METKLLYVRKILNELCDQTYDDTFSVHEMLIDVTTANMEVILKFKRYVIPKIQTMITEFSSVKLDLDAAKQELVKKEEELKNIKECSKCSTLAKELAAMKKKQAINESRIKSIAKILTRCDSETQDSKKRADSDTDSDQSTVTKAYNLVSQMLGCDPLPSIESENEESGKVKTGQKPFKKNSPPGKNLGCHSTPKKNSKSRSKKAQSRLNPKDPEEQEDSEDDILVCSLEETDKENDFKTYVSPKKSHDSKSTGSPVLGKLKKTPVRNISELSPDKVDHKIKLEVEKLEEHSLENSFCIPASPGRDKSSRNFASRSNIQINNDKDNLTDSLQRMIQSSDDKPKKKADYWKLKPTHFIDHHSFSAKKDGSKLRQSKLSLECFPRKVDLCDMEEFNGGIRRSQTSTQISSTKTQESGPSVFKTNVAINHLNANDEDIVMESPDTNISSSRRKGGRLFSSGRKLSFDSTVGKVPVSSEIPKTFCHSSGSRRASSIEHGSQEVEGINDSFDCLKKRTESPKYKYRGAPVRKKSERQQLSGWDCENCRKYYEAAGGANATDEELRKMMNRCSRHRDKNPIRPRTPPGFWDAEFPPTPECEELDRTYMDVLPIAKRSKTIR